MRVKVLCCLLAALCLWLSVTLVRVENQRYALTLGMCRHTLGLVDVSCLAKTQTRSSWFWHLFYSLTS
jgi:hypothetical protein